MRNKLALLSLAAILSASPIVFAEDGPATTQSAPREQLKATISGVQGLVQVRDAEDKPWRKATVGMVLLEDAEFRTGPKSAVQFTIPPDQTVTLDRLGTVKLVQAIKQNGKIITNLGMKYGRTRYDIEAAGQEHESTISSPSSTLAVRGTKVSLYDQRPFNVEAVSLTGRASFRDGKKQLANFGNKGQGKTTVVSGETNAAGVALDAAVVDPTLALARTGTEASLISTLISRGSTVSFDRTSGIRVIRGGVPPTDQQLIPTLPGQLNFVLRWTTDVDLNLCVSSPGGKDNAGELIYPVSGLNVNQSGGHTDFDHRGGPNGGIEIAYWKGNAPDGLFGIGVINASGAAAPATLDVFKNGQRIAFFDGTNNVTTSSFTASPPIPGISQGTLVGIFGNNTSVPGAPGGTPEPGAPPVNGGTTGEPGAPPVVANTASTTLLAAPATSTTTVTAAAKTTRTTSATTSVKTTRRR